MQRTITINRGNQYDGQTGYRMTDGILSAWGCNGKRADGRGPNRCSL